MRGIFSLSYVAFIDGEVKARSCCVFLSLFNNSLVKDGGRSGLCRLEKDVFLHSSDQIFRPCSAACSSKQRFCVRHEWGPAPGKSTEREHEKLHTLLEKTDGNRETAAEICRERKRSMTSLLSRDGYPPALTVPLNNLRP